MEPRAAGRGIAARRGGVGACRCKETTERGSDSTGRIQWETRVEPYVPPDVNPDLERAGEMLGTRLLRVTTDVHFPGAVKGERTLSLATVKLAQTESAMTRRRTACAASR